MRVAYFVQSHRGPRQVERLLGALRRGSPDALLVVGHCPAGEPLDPAVLDALGVLHFTHRRRCLRGYWSLLEPYFDAVELLSRQPHDYEWLVYLSGQDYPIRPPAELEAALAASDRDGYLTWRSVDARSPDGRRRQGRVRYLYRYFELPGWEAVLRLVRPLNRLQNAFNVHLTYGPRLGIRARFPGAASGHGPFVGSQWTILRRRCAERLLATARSRGEVVVHFERTVCPDEAFAQTVLINDGGFRLSNDNLRFVDFQGSSDGRPRTLTRADCPALVAGHHYFARKFDLDVDPTALDWLDAHLAAADLRVHSP
ncbi:MAG TPA: beta-1,6-N-acetylglucosaminyltransferase [Thermoanaerobaculia bacterium]|nr:beta-1,6-N-acetylglucosaminyltransferase [Thermoanaerobaculia bacterium]